MKKLKKCLLALCVVYAAAYIIVGGIDNYKIKNAYEKARIESYKEVSNYDYFNH